MEGLKENPHHLSAMKYMVLKLDSVLRFWINLFRKRLLPLKKSLLVSLVCPGPETSLHALMVQPNLPIPNIPLLKTTNVRYGSDDVKHNSPSCHPNEAFILNANCVLIGYHSGIMLNSYMQWEPCWRWRQQRKVQGLASSKPTMNLTLPGRSSIPSLIQ